MFDLSGKKALVTGATGGIGGAIAKALNARGAIVGLSGRNEDKLQALKNELGERSFILPADLSTPAAAVALIEQAEKALGGLDILVNNAGLTRDNLSLRMKDDEWQEVIDVNLSVPFKLAQVALKTMMKQRWGRIINIASVVGVTGNPGQCNYVASKAGMIGWSKAMAQEIASRNITVNCIAPGFIATAMTDKLNDDQKNRITANIPAGRMGSAEDIAAAALYLASAEAAYVTGQTLHVNGGLAMV